ncbi:hypothetical protein OSB04_012502 [Centaurea solstitialis]|uniref:Prolamin-like domain-containing protein n=1 Tax=Centaurea solstitialis TaxID=347529 RepID=A0AA38TW82_9ASTR|nr:hypothetical protein OSB04_012502 [Centaurea solstitialis]
MNTNMALKSMILFVTLCLASLTSQGLGQGSPSISNKASIMQCWSALFDLGFCYGIISRAAQTGRLDADFGPTCCKAATSMNSGCWPKIFPYNPFFPLTLQIICFSKTSTSPQELIGASSLDVEGVYADAPSD